MTFISRIPNRFLRLRRRRPVSGIVKMMLALMTLNIFLIPQFDILFDVMRHWLQPIAACLDLIARHMPAFRLSVDQLPADRVAFIAYTMALSMLEALTFLLCCLTFFHKEVRQNMMLAARTRAVTVDSGNHDPRMGRAVTFTRQLDWRYEKLILVTAGSLFWLGGFYMTATPEWGLNNRSDDFLFWQSAMFLLAATCSFYLVTELVARAILAWRNKRAAAIA